MQSGEDKILCDDTTPVEIRFRSNHPRFFNHHDLIFFLYNQFIIVLWTEITFSRFIKKKKKKKSLSAVFVEV
jgi:hypothetical protein